MTKKTGPTNEYLKQLIVDLKKQSNEQKVKIWKRVAKDLEKSTRQRRIVNISRLNRFVKKDEIIVVPGKVLGSGYLDKSFTIAAFRFSDLATTVLKEHKCNVLSIPELIKKYPKGTNIKIIG